MAEEDPDPGGYQLKRVGVACEDDGVYLPFARLSAERSEKVVGFVAGKLEYGDVEGAHEVLDVVELGPEFGGSGRAVGLVLGEALVSEGGGGYVEGYGYVGGLPVAQGLEEYVEEAVDGADVLAGGAQVEWLAYGVPGAVNEGVAVYEDEEGLAFEGGLCVGSVHGEDLWRGWCDYTAYSPR